MDVSIIIPNLHSPVVGRTLDSIREQTCDLSSVEIIVVGMDPHNLVIEDDLVSFVRTARPVCAAAARNLGIHHSRGELLAFLDADCVAAPDWLEVLTARFQKPSVQVVVGAVDFPADDYWTLCDNISTFYSWLPTAQVGPRPYAPTINLGVRRAVVDQIGLMDESFPGAAGEDIDWTVRMRLAGYELEFEPRAIIYHHPHRNTPGQLLCRSFNFGANMIKVHRRYQDRISLPSLYRHPFWLVAFAPVLAAGVTARIYLSNRALWRFWYTGLPVFLAKMAWRFGGARQIVRERWEQSTQ